MILIMNNRKLITINSFMFFIIIAVITLLGNDSMLNSNVLPHIKAGSWMVENGKILSNDIFSYTMDGAKWINGNWLMQLIYGFLLKYFGLRGIVSFTAIIIALPFSLIFAYLGKTRANIYVSFLFVYIGCYVSMSQWVIIPFTINFLIITLFFIIIDSYYRYGGNKIYSLIILQILWQNLNSDFVFGYFILGIYIIGVILNSLLYENTLNDIDKTERKRRVKIMIYVFGGLLLSILANPYGYKLISHTIYLYRDIFKFRLGEWRSANFHDFAKIFNYFFIFTLGILAFLKKKRVKMEYLLTILFWQYMFFFAQRHIAIYIIMVIITVPNMIDLEFFKFKWLKKIIEKIENSSENGLNNRNYYISPVFIVVIVVSLFMLNSEIEKRYKTEVWKKPLEGIEYLREYKILGKGIQEEMYGNLLIWEYPEMKVFIDNRTNLYSIDIMNDYGKIFDLGYGWEEQITKYDPNWIMMRSFTPLRKIYDNLKDNWVMVYDDTYTVIYLKKDYHEKWEKTLPKDEEEI